MAYNKETTQIPPSIADSLNHKYLTCYDLSEYNFQFDFTALSDFQAGIMPDISKRLFKNTNRWNPEAIYIYKQSPNYYPNIPFSMPSDVSILVVLNSEKDNLTRRTDKFWRQNKALNIREVIDTSGQITQVNEHINGRHHYLTLPIIPDIGPFGPEFDIDHTLTPYFISRVNFLPFYYFSRKDPSAVMGEDTKRIQVEIQLDDLRKRYQRIINQRSKAKLEDMNRITTQQDYLQSNLNSLSGLSSTLVLQRLNHLPSEVQQLYLLSLRYDPFENL